MFFKIAAISYISGLVILLCRTLVRPLAQRYVGDILIINGMASLGSWADMIIGIMTLGLIIGMLMKLSNTFK